MPQIGEIRRGKEIGRPKSRSDKFIWQACSTCGLERWVLNKDLTLDTYTGLCLQCCRAQCTGARHPKWKGGRTHNGKGYYKIRIWPGDFFYPMTPADGYISEHRLVMAKHLGRCLHPWEIVHHQNGVKSDNRIENLRLVTDAGHRQITRLEQCISKLQTQVRELQDLVKTLRKEEYCDCPEYEEG